MTTSQQQFKKPPKVVLAPRSRYRATIKTDQGDLTVELLTREAPQNVNNFVFLARDGFYRRSSFHRVVEGVLVQGGCPDGDGTGGPGYHITDEEVKRPYRRGTVAMASAGRNKNGSQFFIVVGEVVGFPPNYTIFGLLVDGMEKDGVLDRLAAVAVEEDPRGELSRPVDRLTIRDIVIETDQAGPTTAGPAATAADAETEDDDEYLWGC